MSKLDGYYQLLLHKELMEDSLSAVNLPLAPTSPQLSAYPDDVTGMECQLIWLFSIAIMQYFYSIFNNNHNVCMCTI